MVAALHGKDTAFDSNAHEIAIDNCSSRCLTNLRSDFLPGTVTKCNVAVIGVGGRVKCSVKGTVSWTIEDDLGRAHDIVIPDTPLYGTLPHRLLLPQHWAQETESCSRIPYFGKLWPSCITNADATTLLWGRGRLSKTITLDKRRNVAVMTTKPGGTKYSAFAASVQPLVQQVSCFVATGAPQSSPAEVTDDEGKLDAESIAETVLSTVKAEIENEDEGPRQVDFENHPEAQGVSIEDAIPLQGDKDELYRLHVRAGHLSFAKLWAMAQQGEVPRRLASCELPMCAACQFGKATRKPWRTKKKNRKVKTAPAPGECVSVDQMESIAVGFETIAVGFVAQLKGRLTRGRYRVATIFVDHYSRIGYVHLQKDSTSMETMKAKRAFELYARERGVKVLHYHANNGRFVDNAWNEGLDQENQGITYCGVNAHWQNGIAERRIRDLKEQTRTMLLHAQHHWREATSTSLWPYALGTACHVFNDAPSLKGEHKDKMPNEMFTETTISAEIWHHHTFGCPVYVLQNALQQGKLLAAWLSRARVGVNLGISPTHARSVALVLSLKTGLVSPQFHVKHDNLFETTS
jgi:hypothetical protein